ncbi:MAG TPA: o-succinylbenzoate synthase [Acidimicrobiales bacterium]|nr:o-succinylbenzoate synthase [Acidimicrobiales bacterium]
MDDDRLTSGHLDRLRGVEAPVRVKRAEVFMLPLSLRRTFRSAYGASAPVKRAIVVRLEDADGIAGWGEAPVFERPLFGVDTAESTWSALVDLILPIVVDRSFSGPAELAGSWASFLGQHYAKCAVESAAWAIASERLGVPLVSLWGGVRERVPVGESLPIHETLDHLLDEVALRVKEGFGRIKLKIAPGWDVSPASAVKAAFPQLPLSVDGNCGYSLDSGPWHELDELELVMIEQPLPGDALVEMSMLQERLRTPLCLDESASSYNVTHTALHVKAGRIVNIKPPRLGGILPSVAIHDLCMQREIPVWCGGMLETGIGRGFNLALASLPGFTLHADMSPARIFYAEDLVEPTFEISSDGCIEVPTRAGNGFPVVRERVERPAMRRWTSESAG